MKKFLLAAALLAVGANANAQDVVRTGGSEALSTLKTTNNVKAGGHAIPGVANKGTGQGTPFDLLTDSMYAGTPRILAADKALPIDSGYFYGVNALGDKGFAYLYDLTVDATGNNDTSISILGFVSRWAGKIQPASTKMVTFGVWGRGTDKTLVAGHTKFYVYGKPSASLGAQAVKDTTLKTDGNFTVTALTTPVTGISKSVYVGCTIPYTWSALAADTFGLISTNSGVPASEPNYYDIVAGDTLLDANNMIQNNAGTWKSPVYGSNVGGIGDMVMAPIVAINCPTCGATAVNGVRANNLTIFSSYPNPATNVTNVKFSIAQPASVTVSLVDNTGRLLKAINTEKLSIGEHIVALDLSTFAAGNYIYVVETSAGDRIAAQVTVAK
jgi:hypothetical protein